MQAGFLNLDDLASGIRKPVIFRVECIGKGEHGFSPVPVELIFRLPFDHLAAAAAELHRLFGHLLCDLPDRVVLQIAGLNGRDNLRRAQRLHEFRQNVAGRRCARAKCRAWRTELTRAGAGHWLKPFHAIEQVTKPGASANIGVKPHFAVGHDIEASARLVGDRSCDRVDILFAKQRIAVECRQKRAHTEVLHVPGRPRKGAGDGGCERSRSGCYEHSRISSSCWSHPQRRNDLFTGPSNARAIARLPET